MPYNHFIKYAALVSLLLFCTVSLAQTTEPQPPRQDQSQQPQSQSPASQGSIIDLQDIQIDRSQELPQVLILSRRKTASFDEVGVKKNFQSELTGKTEIMQLMPDTTRQARGIKNIKAMLSKNRF